MGTSCTVEPVLKPSKTTISDPTTRRPTPVRDTVKQPDKTTIDFTYF